jgi:uncharacterized protein with HEPN domain
MKKDEQEYLKHILECLESIEAYTKGIDLVNFLSDEKTQDAVLRKFEVIGEATKQLPQEFRKDLAHISWKDACGMRDMIIHHYFDLDMELIWRTIQEDLPPFKKDIQKLIK